MTTSRASDENLRAEVRRADEELVPAPCTGGAWPARSAC